ncbi:MAG: hypothetical protein M1816_006923 [Peltula sp. TS41687]|nr:MAG: hypothetical protein M1816_006923 [Peltula sp. TS41687]
MPLRNTLSEIPSLCEENGPHQPACSKIRFTIHDSIDEEDAKRLRFDLSVEEGDVSVAQMHESHNALLGYERTHLRVQAPMRFVEKLQLRTLELREQGIYVGRSSSSLGSTANHHRLIVEDSKRRLNDLTEDGEFYPRITKAKLMGDQFHRSHKDLKDPNDTEKVITFKLYDKETRAKEAAISGQQQPPFPSPATGESAQHLLVVQDDELTIPEALSTPTPRRPAANNSDDGNYASLCAATLAAKRMEDPPDRSSHGLTGEFVMGPGRNRQSLGGTLPIGKRLLCDRVSASSLRHPTFAGGPKRSHALHSGGIRVKMPLSLVQAKEKLQLAHTQHLYMQLCIAIWLRMDVEWMRTGGGGQITLEQFEDGIFDAFGPGPYPAFKHLWDVWDGNPYSGSTDSFLEMSHGAAPGGFRCGCSPAGMRDITTSNSKVKQFMHESLELTSVIAKQLQELRRRLQSCGREADESNTTNYLKVPTAWTSPSTHQNVFTNDSYPFCWLEYPYIALMNTILLEQMQGVICQHIAG